MMMHAHDQLIHALTAQTHTDVVSIQLGFLDCLSLLRTGSDELGCVVCL